MKFFKSCSLSFAFLLLSEPAQALTDGILIGNGGGLAEMQALHIDLNFEKHLGLRSQYSDFAKKLEDHSPLLEFDTTCDVKKYRLTQEKIYLSSCALYGDRQGPLGQRPKPLKEIAALIYAVRWLSVHPGDSFEAVLVEARSFYNTFELRQDAYAFVFSGDLKALFTVQKVVQDHLFALEFKNESIDVSADLMSEMKCSSLNKFKASATRVFKSSSEQLAAESLVSWTCENQSYSGRLLFNIAFDDSENVDVDRSQIFLRGVEKL